MSRTVHVDGRLHHFETPEEAEAALERLAATGLETTWADRRIVLGTVTTMPPRRSTP